MEKYHLNKRDLEVVYLHYKKRMSNPEIAKELGITIGQVKYCLYHRFNVEQYINNVVIPDIERDTQRLKDEIKIEMAKRERQMMEDLESDDPKKQKKALKEITKIYRRTDKTPKPMSNEELEREIEEAVKRFGINDNDKKSEKKD